MSTTVDVFYSHAQALEVDTLSKMLSPHAYNRLVLSTITHVCWMLAWRRRNVLHRSFYYPALIYSPNLYNVPCTMRFTDGHDYRMDMTKHEIGQRHRSKDVSGS